ncbi:hypothetical protein niasHT_031065 [Heterodera trifolii]|uniref:Uncharacterized protein n=1 Tax=Heterodera trifolii TaxID=157864 RepID=A0ABD2HVW7_9BILA
MPNGKLAQILLFLLLLIIAAEVFPATYIKKIEKKHAAAHRRHHHSKREIIPICVDFTRRPVECPKKFNKLKLDRLVMQQLNKPNRRHSRMMMMCYLNILPPSPFCFRRKSPKQF